MSGVSAQTVSISGVRVGHFTDATAGTGCTVVIPPTGSVGGVDVRGGGPSTRELELMHPLAGEREISALLLTGGSAFGLAAAAGVVDWCEREGLGLQAGPARVPIVPAAVIFDLGITGNLCRPGPEDAFAACEVAQADRVETGSVGAGTGATVGKILGQKGWCKGGLGYAEKTLYDGATVGAVAVVNCFGDVVDASGEVIAGAWDSGGFVGTSAWAAANPPVHHRLAESEHTTLICVITDASLTKIEAGQVARAANAGLCQAVQPANTSIDGDVCVCISAGEVPANPAVVGLTAPAVVAAAVRQAIGAATSVRGVPTGAERVSGQAE